VNTNRHENMILLCSIYACDRARKEQAIDLPRPGSSQCNELFLATWAAFRHVTTEMGKQRMVELGGRNHKNDLLEAFVHGHHVPAHIRWAETEALIRSGEWP